MAIELADLTIEKLTRVSVREVARIETHHVPGMAGSLSQVMGRPSVEVAFEGIVYGPAPLDDLRPLRDAYLAQEPVGFFTEAVQEGYFSEVLIRSLEVVQEAARSDQFTFRCVVSEYVEPPEPALADPFGGLNADLLAEATAFVDDVQSALEQVSQLTDLLTGFPDFADPTARIGELGTGFTDIAGASGGDLTAIADVF